MQAGLVVYGNDHRGHGRTALSPKHFGDFGPCGFNLLVEDMATLSLIAKDENPGLPFILLGHSMGSFAAQQFVLEHSESLDGLALSGSGALDGLVRLAQSGKRAPAEIVNAAFEPARTPCDWLSRDPATVDAFLADPLCFRMATACRERTVLCGGVPTGRSGPSSPDPPRFAHLCIFGQPRSYRAATRRRAHPFRTISRSGNH